MLEVYCDSADSEASEINTMGDNKGSSSDNRVLLSDNRGGVTVSDNRAFLDDDGEAMAVGDNRALLDESGGAVNVSDNRGSSQCE